MITVESKSPRISKLTFQPFPSKPTPGVVTARCGHIIVGVSPRGNIFVSTLRSNSNAHAPLGTQPRFFGTVLELLVKLKVITTEDRNVHNDTQRELSERREAVYAARNIKETFRLLGIKPTKAQQTKIDKFLKSA